MLLKFTHTKKKDLKNNHKNLLDRKGLWIRIQSKYFPRICLNGIVCHIVCWDYLIILDHYDRIFCPIILPCFCILVVGDNYHAKLLTKCCHLQYALSSN